MTESLPDICATAGFAANDPSAQTPLIETAKTVAVQPVLPEGLLIMLSPIIGALIRREKRLRYLPAGDIVP